MGRGIFYDLIKSIEYASFSRNYKHMTSSILGRRKLFDWMLNCYAKLKSTKKVEKYEFKLFRVKKI